VDPLRFSRHAKNKRRRYGLTSSELRHLLAHAAASGQDGSGNAIVEGEIRGLRIRIVLAHDDPGYVITITERRR